jgi:UDP-N-acetylglucosamine 1-carboxyvinyltransferase
VNKIIPEHIASTLDAFRDMNCKVTVGPDWAEVDARGQELKPITIQTLPFPGYPTDMQAPLMATLLSVPGNSVIQDTVYNDRFKHVAEMQRLGANISLNGNTATIKGGEKLSGADVMGSDLRASAALVLAALIAEGETKISRIYHLDRGYEDFEAKMATLGAKVERVIIDADEP